MPKVVGVRFGTSPKMYWFAPENDSAEYKKGETVLVETQRGVDIGTVVMPTKEVEQSEISVPLKPIIRTATDEEIQSVYIDPDKKREILSTAKQKVQDRGLDMKVVDCEYTVDRSKLVIYFTAENRVDFRELVRDLASAFKSRIDLRQIGARDECKLIGSLGACGLPCCCGRFESDCEHVSIKMAKNQNLALTPNKINGMCGRLLCCLSYENKTYEDVLRRAPKHGATVTAPDGRRGTVVSVTPLTEIVRVRFGDEENFEFADFPLSDLSYELPERPDGGNKKDGAKEKGQGRKFGDGNNPKDNKNRKDNNNNNRKDNNNRGDNNNRVENNNRGDGDKKNKKHFKKHGAKPNNNNNQNKPNDDNHADGN